jgi:hypothetical protein
VLYNVKANDSRKVTYAVRDAPWVELECTAVCCATGVVGRQRRIVGIEGKTLLERILNRMDSE